MRGESGEEARAERQGYTSATTNNAPKRPPPPPPGWWPRPAAMDMTCSCSAVLSIPPLRMRLKMAAVSNAPRCGTRHAATQHTTQHTTQHNRTRQPNTPYQRQTSTEHRCTTQPHTGYRTNNNPTSTLHTQKTLRQPCRADDPSPLLSSSP